MPNPVDEERRAAVRLTWDARREVRTWESLCPLDVARRAPLAEIAACLAEREVREELRADEDAGAYPRRTIARLAPLGLARLLTDDGGPSPALSVPALCALNAIAARASGSLAITLGVNALALLPLYVAGDDAQRADVFARVRRGDFASMMLTELDAGSNLAAIATRAEAGVTEGDAFRAARAGEAPTAYRVSGEKDLVNGAREHAILMVLARTRDAEPGASPLASRGDFSMFWLDRAPGVTALPRWTTLPASAADISGARFDGVVVPAARRLGAEGDGFGIVQKTLIVSRGGIGALASGTASNAAGVALGYALDRRLYDAPIARLAPVAEHLVTLMALDLAVAALSIKAALALNAQGLGAAHLTAVAKYACCRLAEDAVSEGRRLVAARALVRELPYERIARDVLLYGVFDGTSDVMLAQIHWRLQQLVAARASADPDPLAAARAIYTAPARSLVDAVRAPARARAAPLEPYLDALARAAPSSPAATLRAIAAGLLDVAHAARASNAWPADALETVRAADALAMLECAIAIVELADPAARAALGMPPWAEPSGSSTYGIAWRIVALRAIAQGRALAAPIAPAVFSELSQVERVIHAELAQASHNWITAARK